MIGDEETSNREVSASPRISKSPLRLTAYCPRCLRRLHADPSTPVVTCRRCGADVPLTWAAVTDPAGRVARCAVCGVSEFYIESDFPARLGCLVLVGCIVAFLATENLWILVVSGAANVVLWLLLPVRTICYKCLSEYRGAPRHPDHVEYELARGARFADHPKRRPRND